MRGSLTPCFLRVRFGGRRGTAMQRKLFASEHSREGEGRTGSCRGPRRSRGRGPRRAHMTTQKRMVCAASTGHVVAVRAANQAPTLYIP